MAAAKLCRNCKHFPIDEVTMKRSGYVRTNKSAPCGFPFEHVAVPFFVALPLGKFVRKRVCANDGADCAAFEERTDA